MPGWYVRRLGSPPPTGITYTSVLPPIVALYAIWDPSGEKYGSVSSDGVEVNRRASPPARGTTHRSPPYSNATMSWLTVGWRSRRVPWAVAEATLDAIRMVPHTNDRTGITKYSGRVGSVCIQHVYENGKTRVSAGPPERPQTCSEFVASAAGQAT